MSITKMTRRQFVQISGAAAGAATLGVGTLTACGGKDKYPEIPMTDGKLVIDLASHPTLAQAGEGMLFQVPGNVENIVVVHTEAGYVATGAQCPHKGCSVRWNKDEKLLVCPCHKSAFTATGECVRGPGWGKPVPCDEWGKRLRRYNAVEEDGAVVVTAIDD